MQQPWRLSSRGQRWFDGTLIGTLLLVSVVGTLAGLSWVIGLLCVAQFVPLLWRRSHPVIAGALVVAASLAQVFLVDVPILGQAAFPIATYSVARFADARWGHLMLAAGLVGAGVASYDWTYGYGVDGANPYLSYFLTIAAIVATAWALGALGRTREAYVASLVERGERLERDAAQRAQLAAQDERARIAREMHDVVAHGLSVIVVQADGARYAAAREPERAIEALSTISETGRDALAEMRQMLGLLRSEGGSGLAPQPGLGDVDDLVAEARSAGMRVDVRRHGPLPRVADGLGLTVFRIVQESLTNVRKHAGPGVMVEVEIDWDGSALTVSVVDDGRGAAAPSDGQGSGLAGMRERVTAYGGTFSARPVVGGGFAVSARIPT